MRYQIFPPLSELKKWCSRSELNRDRPIRNRQLYPFELREQAVIQDKISDSVGFDKHLRGPYRCCNVLLNHPKKGEDSWKAAQADGLFSNFGLEFEWEMAEPGFDGD